MTGPRRTEDQDRGLIWLGLTPLLPLVGLLPGGRFVLPLLAPALLWPVFSRAVRAGETRRAFAAAMLWTFLLSLSIIVFTQIAPARAGQAILHGEPYRIEMFGWIETGEGRENRPADFLPEHALHLGGFALLTLLSGGYLGLALGAALLGYMSYFVGSFAASASSPIAGSLVAWVPWSVVRVLAFVALGCVLARPLLTRRWSAPDRLEWRWIAAALAGIAVDLLLKSMLAPAYGRFLRTWLD